MEKKIGNNTGKNAKDELECGKNQNYKARYSPKIFIHPIKLVSRPQEGGTVYFCRMRELKLREASYPKSHSKARTLPMFSELSVSRNLPCSLHSLTVQD